MNIRPENLTVLYHADCSDGFGAAWAAWMRFGDAATYIPVRHIDPPPVGLIDTDDVLIVDFAYPKAVLVELEKTVRSIRILDHHKSAQIDLEGVPYATFDMTRSGSGITWDTLHPDTVRPRLINYIEDRDLWNWTCDNTREVLAVLDLRPKDFRGWENFSYDLENTATRYEIIEQGTLLVKHNRVLVGEMALHARRATILGHDVPICNSYLYRSELGNFLAKDEPFAVIWYQNKDSDIVCSLRSKDTGEDVSLIAKNFGGGGHARSAAFTVKQDSELLSFFK